MKNFCIICTLVFIGWLDSAVGQGFDLTVDDLHNKPALGLTEIALYANSIDLSSEACHPELEHIHFLLREFSPSKLSLSFRSNEIPALWTSTLIGKLRFMRENLFNNFQAVYDEGSFEISCLSSLKEFFRLIRSVTSNLNHIAQWRWLKHSSLKYHTLEGVVSSLDREINFRKAEDLRSGDVLVSRGFGGLSAGVAFVGNSDSNFSHLSIFYKHSETGKAYVIDAKSSYNVGVHPAEDFLKVKRARFAVFRHRDPEVAKQAAQFIYDTIQKDLEEGREIIFDLLAQEYEDGKISCSVLVKHSYDQMEPGNGIDSDLFSTIFFKNESFSKRFGSSNGVFFLPGDMETQPNFKLIAEWYEPYGLLETQLYDVSMFALFDWIENKDYQIIQSSGSKTSQKIVQKSQNGEKGLIDMAEKNEVPQTMSPGFVALVVDLKKISKCLVGKLKTYEKKFLRETGYPMGWQERLDYLSSLREVAEQKGRRLCRYLQAPETLR